MAMSNHVDLEGHVGKPPEMHKFPDGTPVINFTMATNEPFKDKKTGERRENTEWHNVAFFGKAAESLFAHTQKGTPLRVWGRLRTRKWTDDKGIDRYITEIIGERFKFGPKKQSGERAQPAVNDADAPPMPTTDAAAPPPPPPPTEGDFPEDNDDAAF